MNYHASQLSHIRGKYSNQAPSNLSNSHRKFPLHNNLHNKRGSARIPSSSNLRSRIIAAILRSPYAIKHLDERATKPQNHETIFIYTRLTVPPLERDTEGERERDAFWASFSVHVDPNGTQMTHGKRGEGPNGEGKREKHVFFPSQSHTWHKSYGKSSSPVVFACVLDYTRARAPSSPRPRWWRSGREGWWRLSVTEVSRVRLVFPSRRVP